MQPRQGEAKKELERCASASPEEAEMVGAEGAEGAEGVYKKPERMRGSATMSLHGRDRESAPANDCDREMHG